MKISLLGLRGKVALVLATLLAIALLPAVALHEAVDTWSLSFDEPDYAFHAKVRGKVAITAAEDDVTDLDGSVMLKERRNGMTRRIELTSRGGSIRREFFIDGDLRPMDAAATQWYIAALRRFIRESGLDAAARVQRLYRAGGAAGVLDEVSKISAGHVRCLYLRTLLTTQTLDDAAMRTLLSLTGEMRSDFERRQVLTAAFEQPLSASNQVAALQITGQLRADFEQRSVLTLAANKLADEPAVFDAWFAALEGVDSDFERRSTLESIVGSIRRQAGTEQMLDAIARIESDFESRQALVALAPLIDTPALAVRYATLTRRIGSAFERRQALQSLMDRSSIDGEVALAILAAIDGMRSDFETRMALEDLAARMPGNSAVIRRYNAVASRLSEFERIQAERALDRFAL